MDELVFPILGAECKLPVYVVGVGRHLNQHPIERKSGFPYFQVIYCTNGSGVLRIGNVDYQVNKQQAIFLYPDEPHEYSAREEPWETHWLTFDGSEVLKLVQSLGFIKSSVFYLRNSVSLDDLWGQILLESKSEHNDRGFKCSALSYYFLILLNTVASEDQLVLEDEKLEKLNVVLSYIDKYYKQDLSMDELSKCIGISPQYLCRIFKRYMNMRPFEYVAKKRIQEAKKLLIEKKLSEAHIAEQCGFNSFSYFCAIFKRLEHITPTEFRKLHLSE